MDVTSTVTSIITEQERVWRRLPGRLHSWRHRSDQRLVLHAACAFNRSVRETPF